MVLFATIKQKLMFFLLGKADLGSHWRWRRHGTFMFWPFKYRVYGGKNLAWQELSPGSDSSPGRTVLKLVGTSNWKFSQNFKSRDFENLMIFREFKKARNLNIHRNIHSWPKFKIVIINKKWEGIPPSFWSHLDSSRIFFDKCVFTRFLENFNGFRIFVWTVTTVKYEWG